MREIKFRAWDKNSEEMNITVSGLTGIDNPNNDDPLKYVCGNKNVIDWKDCELMQYTGLKDKNGKEIYEGDILKFNTVGGNEMIYDVRWKGTGFKPTRLSEHNQQEIEIIGNIYENKELIK